MNNTIDYLINIDKGYKFIVADLLNDGLISGFRMLAEREGGYIYRINTLPTNILRISEYEGVLVIEKEPNIVYPYSDHIA